MKTLIIKVAFGISVSLILHSLSHAHGEKKHESEDKTFDAIKTAFGSYEPGLEPTQTIEISMADSMRFTPSELEIKKGDVVKFVITNDGELLHEFVLGTPDSLSVHADLMIENPDMEHDEAFMAHVDPGKDMELIWLFNKSGTFEFGCLIPGHFQAGMKGTITVL